MNESTQIYALFSALKIKTNSIVYVGKKKLVKCSLKHVQFESSIGNHHHSYMGQVREHSFLSHNFDIWRLPMMTSDEDEVVN